MGVTTSTNTILVSRPSIYVHEKGSILHKNDNANQDKHICKLARFSGKKPYEECTFSF